MIDTKQDIDIIKQRINYMSYGIIILPILLMILLPMPYDGINPVLFMMGNVLNVAALVLFLLLMISVVCLGWVVFHFTRVLTYRQIKRTVTSWSRFDSLEKIHNLISPISNILNEVEKVEKKEVLKKQKEYVELLNQTWENEKKLNLQDDLEIKKDLEELEELRQYKHKQEIKNIESIEDKEIEEEKTLTNTLREKAIKAKELLKEAQSEATDYDFFMDDN